MMLKRNINIELARVLFMIGICATHAVFQGGLAKPWWSCLLNVNIGAFVFLSGWFGIRFSWYKILRLLATGAYATVVAFAGNIILTGQMDWHYLRLFKWHWFLWTYLGLMMLAPMLDIMVEQSSNAAILLLAMAFGWGFSFHLPIIGSFLGTFPGLANNGIVSFMGIYAAARLLRKYDGWVLSRGDRGGLYAVVVGGIGVLLTRYGGTASPFSFLVGAGAVMMARKINMPNAASKVISWLSPSLFSIYLIHSNSLGFSIIKKIEITMLDYGYNTMIIYGVVTIILFLGSLICDVPRRMAISLANIFVNKKSEQGNCGNMMS